MLAELTCKRNKLILFIIAALTVFFAYHAAGIKINADISNLMPVDKEFQATMEEFGQAQSNVGIMVLAIEGDNLFSLEGLRVFNDVIGQIEELPGILPGIHPFNFLSFQKKGSRLSAGYLAEHREAPKTPEELADFKEKVLSDPFAAGQVVSRDGSMLAALFPLGSIADTEETARLHELLEPLKTHYRVYVTGDNFFTEEMNYYLFDDLKTLMILAVIFILILYYISFRSRRAMFLPLGLILISITWCLGFMSLMDYSITVMNIILPPLLLTIGSSYSVHILNGYYRESRPHLEKREWIVQAVSHASATVILAGITTIVGFSSLLATSIYQTRQFGISMSFGIFTCVLLSLTFLPAALSCMPPPKGFQKDHVLQGKITRFMQRLSLWVIQRKRVFFFAFATIILLFILLIPGLRYQSDYQGYFPRDSKIILETNYILKKLGSSQQLYVTFEAPEGQKNYFLDPEVLSAVNGFEEALLAHPDVVAVDSFTNYLRGLNTLMYDRQGIPENKGLILSLSRYFQLLRKEDTSGSIGLMTDADYSRITSVIRVYNHETGKFLTESPFKEFTEFIETTAGKKIPEDLKHTLWGSSMQYQKLSDTMNRDQSFSIALSMILIALITAAFFKSILYGLLSLIPIIFGVMINFIVMVLVGIPLDMITIMVSSVTVGVGVDDAIHFLIQFKRQKALHRGNRREAFFHTYSIAGRPILLTTVAILGGLCILLFSNFLAIKYFGFLLCLTLSSTLIGTLFILPAFCRILYRKMG
ncbi:MAG: RND family transporter [Spirochaetales bacterium]|nr:RND family transporter [Spirochaetales bacterium]